MADERCVMTNMKAGLAGQVSGGVGADFAFADFGPLVDGELELVVPDERWIDDVMAACGHPLTQAEDVEHAPTTRVQLEQSVRTVPQGRDPGDATNGRIPTYSFWMRLRPECNPPVLIAGGVSLRVGQTADLVLYFGHIGYNVYPPARGHHYAARACRLLFGLARHHGLGALWVTTDPSNLASRRTCEYLGGVLVDIVDVPCNHILYQRGQKRKCRYRINL